MAGEDPGVSTLAVILELIQRAWAAATGSIKAVVSGTVDIIKTSLFFSWRRKMMQGQTGPDLNHGQQSLKNLRLHEQAGAHIVSVEIGDFKAMDALCEELKRLELDFAITEHDYQYTLHYKEANEQDVLYAQQAALEKLYGDPNKAADDNRETPSDPDQRDEHDRDGDEGREQNEQQAAEQRQEQEREAEERQRDQQEQEQAEQQTRNQTQTQGHPTPEQTVPAAAAMTGAASAHTQERASQMEAPEPLHRQENAAALKPNQRFEPLEDLIKEARERARAKNMARNHPERAMRLDHHRSLTRERARNFEPGH